MTRRAFAFLAAAVLPLAPGACDHPKPRGEAAAGHAAAEGVAPPLTAGLPKRPGSPGFYLDHIGPVLDPANRPSVVAAADKPILLDGFGFDPVAKAPGRGVDVVVDGRPYGTVYGLPRPDVADFYKTPGLVDVGYRTTLPPGTLAPGPHEARVRVLAADGAAYFESPAVKFEVR